MFANKFPRLFLVLDGIAMFAVVVGLVCWAALAAGNLIDQIREWRYSLRGKVKKAFTVPAADKLMTVIFLDIDGVLVTAKSYQLPGDERRDRAEADPFCVHALNALTDATGAVLVVTSTLRREGLMAVKDILRGWGVTGKVLDRTPFLERAQGDIVAEQPRWKEIRAWLDSYVRPIDSFIILDDEGGMGPFTPHLIPTDMRSGLTVAHVEKTLITSSQGVFGMNY